MIVSGKIRGYLKSRWAGDGGYRQVLVLAFPLILSTGSWSIQHFVDRMFLTWYSPEAVAACMPSGLLNFTLVSVFLGTAGYVSTFVAQYHGAERPDRIGPSVWQGIYVAVLGALFLGLTVPLAGTFFRWVGHAPQVQVYETIYFRILAIGAAPVIAASAMSGFFSGLGRTWAIMWINFLATAVNIVGDYVLIFGYGGFPKMGIAGAAVATVFSAYVSFAAYLVLFAREPGREKFQLFRGWRPDRVLFRRLLYFGFPSGAQFFLDIAGFTIFLLLLGRLGTVNLAATNIAFNINTFAFMPMIGFGIAVSVLVGQNLGRNRPDLAERSTYAGFHMTLLYMITVAALYFFTPDLFITPFIRYADPQLQVEIRTLAVVLLRFVAFYSIFDTMNIIFASALRGAGDTRYVMVMLGCVSLVVLVIPSYLALELLGAGLYTGWAIGSAYVVALGFAFLFRFLGGRWKSMRVIEEISPAIPSARPESPVVEAE